MRLEEEVTIVDKSSIARMICERYGIEWDENQSISHIGEKAVAQGMISAALGQNCLDSYDYTVEMRTMDRRLFPEYNMKKMAALVA